MIGPIVRKLLLAGAAISEAACNSSGERGGTASAETKNVASEVSKDPIASAEAAAPAPLARDATILAVGESGTMKTLRRGKNGWTCISDNPDTPGPDPMCMDGNAAKWIQAMIGRKPPPDGSPGLIYMLEGGTDASNTDPFAKQPASGQDWIKTGPHIMIVGSRAMLTGYPTGTRPNTSAPYVMWAGTAYAHLMVPVERS